MKHFLKTDLCQIALCQMPACCLNCSTYTSMTQGARVWYSSGVGLSALPYLNKSSLTECSRLCQVSEKRRLLANIGYPVLPHLCLSSLRSTVNTWDHPDTIMDEMGY